MTDVKDLNRRGLQDALAALAQIEKDITNAEKRAEQRAGEAEAELNSLRRLHGFVTITIETHRARLRAITDAEQSPKPD